VIASRREAQTTSLERFFHEVKDFFLVPILRVQIGGSRDRTELDSHMDHKDALKFLLEINKLLGSEEALPARAEKFKQDAQRLLERS